MKKYIYVFLGHNFVCCRKSLDTGKKKHITNHLLKSLNFWQQWLFPCCKELLKRVLIHFQYQVNLSLSVRGEKYSQVHPEDQKDQNSLFVPVEREKKVTQLFSSQTGLYIFFLHTYCEAQCNILSAEKFLMDLFRVNHNLVNSLSHAAHENPKSLRRRQLSGSSAAF